MIILSAGTRGSLVKLMEELMRECRNAGDCYFYHASSYVIIFCLCGIKIDTKHNLVSEKPVLCLSFSHTAPLDTDTAATLEK